MLKHKHLALIILRLFRPNLPTGYIVALVLAVIFWMVDWDAETSNKLYFSFRTVDLPGSKVVWKIAGLVLLFAQGLWLNHIHNVSGIFEERSNTVLLLYILFGSTIPATHSLSAPLIASTFLIPAWQQIFAIYNQHDVYRYDFNAALLAGIAALLYLPSILIVLVLWTALVVIRTIAVKDLIFSLLGMLIPVIYWWFAVFIMDSTFQFEFQQHLYGTYSEWNKTDLILAGVLILIGVLGWGSSMGKVTMRRRNFYLLLIVGLLVGVVPFAAGLQAVYGCIVSSSVVLAPLGATYFNSFNRKWLPEMLVTVWVGFIIAFQLIG